MSADTNLNLGGNADFIRPKYNLFILGTFFMHECRCKSHKNHFNNRKDETNES